MRTKAFFYLFAGILAGFAVLLLTVWGDTVPDSRGLGGALLAMAVSLLALAPAASRRRSCGE